MRLRILTACAIACILTGIGLIPAHQASANPTCAVAFCDDFQSFSVTSQANPVPGAKWFYFEAGPFLGNDGITTPGPDGLTVVPKGVNPDTGKPAFTSTVGQDGLGIGLPGAFDHVKWLVYANHQASSGYPGFDVLPGKETVCQATISGRTFGNSPNPFHQYVSNPDDDLRLGAVALPNIDLDTFNVFDTWVTNQHIWAFYEHLPFARGSLGGHYDEYAAYSSAIPIYKRSVNESDTVDFAYSFDAGTQTAVARWLVNGVERWRVPVTIGTPPPTSMMLIDHGGTPENFAPKIHQIDCGMGMFTLLDGYGKGNKGLVRLNAPLTAQNTPAEPHYFVPGTTTPAQFVDEQSLPQNRLWGQGAEMHVSNFSVQYWTQ